MSKEIEEMIENLKCAYNSNYEMSEHLSDTEFNNIINALTEYEALLKAQEPKQYLKWEDLEFTEEPKGQKVKMNNNDYILRYTLDIFGGKTCFLYNEAKSHHIELTKQFFNDLRLERVE